MMSSARYPGHRNFTLVRECACCHTKTMVTYSTSKIWLTTLRQTFYLTSIQINFMKRDKNSQIFCIANKFNHFHILNKYHLFVTLFREKRAGNLKLPHVDISPTLNKPRNLISGFVLVTLDFSLTRKKDATLSKK